jgi:hypothetical protein
MNSSSARAASTPALLGSPGGWGEVVHDEHHVKAWARAQRELRQNEQQVGGIAVANVCRSFRARTLAVSVAQNLCFHFTREINGLRASM